MDLDPQLMTNFKSEVQGDKIVTTFDYHPQVSAEYVFITFSFKIDKISAALGDTHYVKKGKLYRKES